MANAVFNSYEDYLSKNTSNPVQHNSFDLSHIRSFTTTYGALIPFYLEDCLPSDHFDISNVVRVQSLPMSNPLLNNIKVQTWYFYVPYYLLWRKFDLFISGGRDGTYTAQLPFVHTRPSPNSLGDYFGFPIDKDPENSNFSFDISAFPYAAYQRIYRDYFLNQDNQTNTNVNYWFPSDDDDFSLPDGVCGTLSKVLNPNRYYQLDSGFGNYHNDLVNEPMLGGIGYDTSDTSILSKPHASKVVPYLQLIRFRNFNRDYFTSAMFSPQRGPAMGLGMTNQSPFTASDFSSLVTNTLSSNHEVPQLTFVSDPSSAKLISTLADLNTVGPDSISPLLSRLGNVFANKISSAITISDIMTASQVQLWMERNMQVKAQYNEFLRVHFGDAPLDERLTRPYYIGGSSQYINVNAVVQTSESSTTPQGTMTGLGSTKDSQFIGKFSCHEFGLIMGIMCIMPDIFYTDGMDKRWLKTSKFDFVFPEFSQLPPEPIFNKEIFWDNTDSVSMAFGESVFGYSGRYDLYRHRRSLAVSDLRNPHMTDFSSWIIRRSFSSTPSLNSWDFNCTLKGYGGVISIPAGYTDTSVTPNVRYDYNNIPMSHFPTGNLQNPFIVQVGLSIRASRPLPYRNEPQTLNLRRG